MTPYLLLLAVAAAPAALACEMMAYKRVQASPHVHVFEAAEGTTAVVNGNIVAVVGRDAVLVVDTGQFPSIARRALAEITALTRAPVRYVVNTHWHGDHLLANSVFKEAYPAVKIMAHSHTIEQGARFYSGYATKMAERLPAVIADMKKQREASASEEEKLWITKTLDCVEQAQPDMAVTTYLAPDTVVDTSLRIDLGDVTVTVKHIGSANTPGDLVAWVEEDRLVATGDMVVAPVPYAIGSAIGPWIRTLAELRALRPAVIVPGHGPVMRDDRYVRDVEALLTDTREQLARLHRDGVPKADAPAKIENAAFRARYVDTPMRRQAFEQFFVKPAVQKYWAEMEPAPAAKPP